VPTLYTRSTARKFEWVTPHTFFVNLLGDRTGAQVRERKRKGEIKGEQEM